jgi:hypothetical protein
MKAKLLRDAGEIIEGTEVRLLRAPGRTTRAPTRMWEDGAPPSRPSTR